MKTVCLLSVFCLLYTLHSHASTKSQLQRLEAHVLSLKKQLSQAENNRDKLYQKLAKTEKKISDDLHALHRLTPEEKEKKQAIQTISTRIELLNEQLKQQEKMLANHVRSRHRLGTLHPWQFLIAQETPQSMSRLFVFYRYLFQADQKIINQIKNTQATLSKTKTTLSLEQKKLHALQSDLLHNKNNLIAMKKEQKKLIKALNEQIQSKHDQLISFNADKIRLQSLIKKLSISPEKQSHAHQIKLAGKAFDSPLKISSKQMKPLNQGLILLAKEGTPVFSVLPGKVIFSDWLKGYGLLLIIDHGSGIMSLYAHNESLFKSLGASVEQGDQIATVGHTGGLRENGLYFELRRRGKAVPPREWMS